MQAQMKDRSEIKVFILYLMHTVGHPLDFCDIHDITVQNGIVSSFDFMDSFPELIESGHIEKIADENGNRNGNDNKYTVTALGRNNLSELENMLLPSTKDAARKNANMFLEMKKQRSDVNFGISPTEDGRYKFWCKYFKDGKETFCLSMIYDKHSDAELLKNNFEKRPDEMSRAFSSILKGAPSDDMIPG